jgi:hypothetical protein
LANDPPTLSSCGRRAATVPDSVIDSLDIGRSFSPYLMEGAQVRCEFIYLSVRAIRLPLLPQNEELIYVQLCKGFAK